MKYLLFLSIAICILSCDKKCPDCEKCPQRLECSDIKLPALIGVEEADNTLDTINIANVGIKEADVLTNGDNFDLKATIYCDSNGNNDAHNVEVKVLLPAEVNIISFEGPNGCLILSNESTYTDSRIIGGYIKFEKRSITINETFDIKVTTSKPLKANASTPNFAIFVHNISPENKYDDNYWKWK